MQTHEEQGENTFSLHPFWGTGYQARAAAQTLYQVLLPCPFPLDSEREWAIATFLNAIVSESPTCPKTVALQRLVLIHAMVRTLHLAQTERPLCPSRLTVALWPLTTLPSPESARALCDLLVFLYHRSVLFTYPKPQVYWLEQVFQKALCAQKAPHLLPFWQLINTADPLAREAFYHALNWLRAGHAVAHLLFGLQTLADHALRMTLVNLLEEIAEPQSLLPLVRLHKETAETDWPLSRRIARAVQLIAHQNASPNPTTLLRPAARPEYWDHLLQPFSQTAPFEATLLPRSAPAVSPNLLESSQKSLRHRLFRKRRR